jgi:hypothetical protein
LVWMGYLYFWFVTWPQTPTRMDTSLGNIQRVQLIFYYPCYSWILWMQTKHNYCFMRFQPLTAVKMRFSLFWLVTHCMLAFVYCIWYILLVQSSRVKQCTKTYRLSQNVSKQLQTYAL